MVTRGAPQSLPKAASICHDLSPVGSGRGVESLEGTAIDLLICNERG